MTGAVGRAVVAVVVVLSLGGCTSHEDPGPVTTVIPTVAVEGADLVCGMDRVDLETAMGMAIGRVEDGLSVTGGVGSGECTVWAENESLVNGPLLFVTFFAASSPDGLEARARIDGDGFRAPDVPYESLDGGAWGDVEGEPGHMTLGATSRVFWGQTVIKFTTARGGAARDLPADLVALTQQVAASYGLPDAGGTT